MKLFKADELHILFDSFQIVDFANMRVLHPHQCCRLFLYSNFKTQSLPLQKYFFLISGRSLKNYLAEIRLIIFDGSILGSRRMTE